MRSLILSRFVGLSAVSSALILSACGDDGNVGPSKPPVIGADAGDGGNSPNPSNTVDPSNPDGGPNPNPSSTGTNTSPQPSSSGGRGDGGGVIPTDDGGLIPTDDGGVVPTDDGGGVVPTDDGGGVVEPDGGGNPGPTCVENDEACISCPDTSEEYLNRCTDSECSPFDNEARIGDLYVPGQALPDPP